MDDKPTPCRNGERITVQYKLRVVTMLSVSAEHSDRTRRDVYSKDK